MFTTPTEGLDVYRKELSDFAEWLSNTIYNSKAGQVWSTDEWSPWRPSSEPHDWPTRAYEEAVKRNTTLKGMEKALGLEELEVLKEYADAGFHV